MAHGPRRAPQTKRIPIRGEDLSGLNSEVLKLRLGVLNLPITGSKGQLHNRLKWALQGNSAKPRGNTANSKQKRMSSRSHVNTRPGRSTRNNNGDRRNIGETNLPYLAAQCRDRHRKPKEHFIQFSSALCHRRNRVTFCPHRLKHVLHSS